MNFLTLLPPCGRGHTVTHVNGIPVNVRDGVFVMTPDFQARTPNLGLPKISPGIFHSDAFTFYRTEMHPVDVKTH